MFSFIDEKSSLNSAYPTLNEMPPKSTLGYGANNKYPGFPPLMNDGRSLIASWQSDAVINNDLVKHYGITSNNDYRQQLIHNAKDIMRYNFYEACNDIGYFKRYQDTQINSAKMSTSGYMYKSLMDNGPENRVPRNPVNAETDLKQLYLSREKLQSLKIAPEITQDQLLKNRGKQ